MRAGALPRPVWALDAELEQVEDHYYSMGHRRQSANLGSLPRLPAQWRRGDPGGLLLEEHLGTVDDARGLVSPGGRWPPGRSGNESDASGVSSASRIELWRGSIVKRIESGS